MLEDEDDAAAVLERVVHLHDERVVDALQRLALGDITLSAMPRIRMFRFSSTFSAYSLPEDFFFASSTVPKPPSPSFESTWKSEILSAAGGAEGPPGAALTADGRRASTPC